MKNKIIFMLVCILVIIGNICIANDSINEIRNLYQETQRKISEGLLLETKIDLVSNQKIHEELAERLDFGAGFYKFYSDLDKCLVKIETFKASGSIIMEEEILFDKQGHLAFFYLKNTNALTRSVLNEERYYYTNNKLIRYIIDKKIFEANFPKEAQKNSILNIERASRLKDIFIAIITL